MLKAIILLLAFFIGLSLNLTTLLCTMVLSVFVLGGLAKYAPTQLETFLHKHIIRLEFQNAEKSHWALIEVMVFSTLIFYMPVHIAMSQGVTLQHFIVFYMVGYVIDNYVVTPLTRKFCRS